ncbi:MULTISPECIES: hypothetical protein [unclassified Pseudovibrio]|uniref:hypothetical protein n=1 Tax=unclassified Pseudovibrio TaxID=2627060 RepID=UPI0007B21ABB|nr:MULTISPECIES: hypothetical protein [unclassified Pseudovibrio]KZK85758.1 hypothetical protein PsAD46_03349 [Pseudovibrio sp. Ad46]KZL10699.1 hypothetical protein PsAD26_03064 [Pseudovibrio sp. Ad26]
MRSLLPWHAWFCFGLRRFVALCRSRSPCAEHQFVTSGFLSFVLDRATRPTDVFSKRELQMNTLSKATLAFMFGLAGCLSAQSAEIVSTQESATAALLTSVEKVRVQIVDTVHGDCSPEPEVLKDKSEGALRKNGIPVTEDTTASNAAVLYLTLTGFKPGSRCAVMLEAKLSVNSYAIAAPSQYLQEGTRFSNVVDLNLVGHLYVTDSDMHWNLTEAAGELANEAAKKILHARDFKFEYK